MMTNQRFALDAFWSRYGHGEIDQSDFSKALDRLPDISVDGPWLAGGSVRRLLCNQPQDSDFDFFFRDQSQFDDFVAAMKARGAEISAENDFNITFHMPATKAKPIGDNEFSSAGPALKVQAIRISFYESIDAVIDSFDFSLCQTGFDGTDIVAGQWALWDIANKRLVPGRITYGTSSLRRMIKYARQGFSICSGGLANMLEQIAADPSIIQQSVEYID